MAIDLLLDKNTHDLKIVDGDLGTTTKRSVLLRQRLAITFKAFVGEFFANINFGGIDKQIVLGKPYEKSAVDGWFINVINSFSEVESIVSFESELDRFTRNYDLRFVVRTSEGPVAFFVRAGSPENEILYTADETALIPASCDMTDVERSNLLYEYLHITLPTTDTLMTDYGYSEESIITEEGHAVLTDGSDFLNHE